jgi:hypothetical protein
MNEPSPSPTLPRGRRIPSIYDTDENGYSHSCSEPSYLCSNWFTGCNAVTDGPVDGRLSFCDECLAELNSLSPNCEA